MNTLENEFFRIEITEDGSRLIIDTQCGCCEIKDYATTLYGGCIYMVLPEHGKVQVSRAGNGLVITIDKLIWFARFPENGYLKPDPAPDFRYTFRIRLEGDEAIFTTDTPQGLDEEPQVIGFPKMPLRWDTAKQGTVVGTFNSLGTLFKFPDTRSGDIEADSVLPVAGYFNEHGGLGYYCSNLHDQVLHCSINQPQGTGMCGFYQEFVKGKSEYSREVRLKAFKPGSNYVSLAKWYRSVVKRENRFITLAEKIIASPEVGKLAGALIWKHNVYPKDTLPEGIEKDYSLYVLDKQSGDTEGKPNNWTAKEIFDTAHTVGFDRVCVLNTGWNNQGFDSGYPTRFPVNPLRGTESDFTRAAKYGRSLSPDYIFCMHDNYNLVYRNSPEFNIEEICANSDGVPVQGGIWRGGRSYQMCSKCAYKYAQRDLPRIGEMCGRGAIYLDVYGCVDRLNCFHPDHPGNRREDAQGRIRIFQLAKKYIGAVATEGAPYDFAIPYIDLGAYPVIRNYKNFNTVPIPFFQLVYHDSLYNFAGLGVAGVSGTEYINRVALYGMLPWDFSEASLQISRELRHAFTEEMVSHEFLNEQVEKTVFSDGTEVIANFSDVETEHLKPHNFIIRHS